eukprot:5819196-Pyramimonas_sp.AAC.2
MPCVQSVQSAALTPAGVYASLIELSPLDFETPLLSPLVGRLRSLGGLCTCRPPKTSGENRTIFGDETAYEGHDDPVCRTTRSSWRA